jgi:hypothetical protein
VLLSCSCVLAACGRQSADEVAIVDALTRMFDKPESRLVVGPIAASGNAALADWTQGALGGRALLKRHDGQWSIELCGGDSIKNESALAMAGIAPAEARKIVAEISEEEKGEPTERLKFIAAFRGVVRMDAHGTHP